MEVQLCLPSQEKLIVIIYLIKNKINGKKYIGQTIRSLELRWKEHLRRKDDFLIHKAIMKYGKDNFEIELVEKTSVFSKLNNLERYYIKTLDTLMPNGYNMTSGGSEITKEIRKKISLKTKGKKKRPWTQREKDAQSERLKGKKRTGKALENHNLAMRTKGHSKMVSVRDQNGIIYRSIREAARELGMSHRSVLRVLKGKQKETKGYSFEYYNKE